jgi:hypothetical protein
MNFARFVGICLGFVIATGPALAQTKDGAVPRPSSVQPESVTPPAQPREKSSSAAPEEISHEEMVKEQERRDRAEEEERDRDDQ